MSERYIYKILLVSEYEEASARQELEGAPIDIQDGFIHFSKDYQTCETADKHFRGRGDLYLLQVATKLLDSKQLKYEISRGGDSFPHLYGVLPFSAVTKTWLVPMLSDDSYDFSAVAEVLTAPKN